MGNKLASGLSAVWTIWGHKKGTGWAPNGEEMEGEGMRGMDHPGTKSVPKMGTGWGKMGARSEAVRGPFGGTDWPISGLRFVQAGGQKRRRMGARIHKIHSVIRGWALLAATVAET